MLPKYININILLEWASDIACAELEKEIEEFVEWLISFNHTETIFNFKDKTKLLKLESINFNS